MKNAQMKVIKFDENDVIATSEFKCTTVAHTDTGDSYHTNVLSIAGSGTFPVYAINYIKRSDGSMVMSDGSVEDSEQYYQLSDFATTPTANTWWWYSSSEDGGDDKFHLCQ